MSVRFRFRAFAVAVLALLPGACSHVPATSLLALSRLDFATTDLRLLRAALRHPAGFQPRANRMIIEVGIEGHPKRREEFLLQRLGEPHELSALAAHRRAGAELAVYRLPDEAIRVFETLRVEAAKARAEKRKGSLTISLKPDLCYLSEPPKGHLLFSSYLRTSETRVYVPVLIDLDALAHKDYAEKAREMPKC